MKETRVNHEKEPPSTKDHINNMASTHTSFHSDMHQNGVEPTTSITCQKHHLGGHISTENCKIFVDETLRVKRKVKKSREMKCSRLRKPLKNEQLLENYFEWNETTQPNNNNQLKKFKMVNNSKKLVQAETLLLETKPKVESHLHDAKQFEDWYSNGHASLMDQSNSSPNCGDDAFNHFSNISNLDQSELLILISIVSQLIECTKK